MSAPLRILRRAPLATIAAVLAAAPATSAARLYGGFREPLGAGEAAPSTTVRATPARSRRAILVDGIAHPPASAPLAVRLAIWAGDELQNQPYVWGGGHGGFRSSGYDCSGSVSFVLHAAGALDTPLVAAQLMSYGRPGPGRWITIYASATHTFMFVAGLRLDTSGGGPSGPRWRTVARSLSGFVARHPAGL